MCGAHDAIYELTAYRDPNLVPIKAFYEPVPKVCLLLIAQISWFRIGTIVWTTNLQKNSQKVLLITI